jgi:hypothetical protein
MRKLFAIAVMALAALAVAAPSASAMDPGPPYGTDAEDWTGVYVLDERLGIECMPDWGLCTSEGIMSPWSLVTDPMVSAYNTIANCTGYSESAFEADGSFDTSVSHFTGPSYYDCSSIDVQNAPWSGQMCVHVGSGEVWARQDFDITVGPYGNSFAGESFGRIEVDVNGHPSLEFDNAYIGTRGSFDYGQDSVHYWNGYEIRVEANAEAACSWPELQA